MIFHRFVLLLLLIGSLFCIGPTYALDPYGKGYAPGETANDINWLPPYHTREEKTGKPDPKKHEIAERLSEWVRKTMTDQHAVVGIIGRQGNETTKRFDKTGLAHAGFIVHMPGTDTWVTFNLFSDPTTKRRTQAIWQASLEDFYYGQTGYVVDTLLLIPDHDLQEKILAGFTSGNYKKLAFTDQYNLIANPFTPYTLNCTKWLLMNIYGAKTGNYNPYQILELMRGQFKEQIITPDFITRLGLRFMSNVRLNEKEKDGKIHTVTVQSLYDSTLFTQKLFYQANSMSR